MTRVLDAIHLVLKLALGLLVAGLLVPVTMQILARFFDFIPRYIWTEEIARFCFVWMIMVGAMCAVRDGTHFDLEVLPESPNPKVEAAKRLDEGQKIALAAVQSRFQATSQVNVDREMSTLIELQAAYAANARIISTVKEMMDVLMRV